MRFSDLPRVCRAYVSVVCASALAAATWAALTGPSTGQIELAVLITIAAVVAHSFPVSTPGKQAYHVSLPFFVAAIVLLEPAYLLVAIAAVHLAEHLRKRRSGFAQIFNAAAYGLAAIAAYGAFHAVWPAALELAQPSCLLAGVIAAFVFTAINRMLVSVAIWLGNGIPPREQHMFTPESLVTDGILLLMGLPLAQLAVIAPWIAAAAAAPLWLIHRALDLPNVRAQRRQDGLTQLFSAPYLTETCTRELQRARRFARSTALVLLDLDGLGELNTMFGPPAGDAVIRGTAAVVRKATREYDLAARLGGGMFAVLLPETDLAQAQVVAERIRRSVAERRYEMPGSVEQVRVTVSVGAVIAGPQAHTAEQLFAAAERVLAQAKAVGGNRSEFCELDSADEQAQPQEEATAHTSGGDSTVVRALTGVKRRATRRLAKIGLVATALVVAAWALVSQQAALDWPVFGTLLVLLIALERRTLEPVERSGRALSLVPLVAGGMLLGPLGAVGLAVGLGVARAVMRRRDLTQVVLETSAGVLVAVPASLGFSAFGALLLVVPPLAMRYLSRRHVERAVDSVRKLRTLNEQLEHRAFHDPLTNLANRALFSERLEHAIRRAEDGGIAVLFLDLDNFKTVNDTLGHAAGDALLTIATQRLRQCVRWEDTIARLGGDEFTVLLENVRDVSQVARSAERIADALRQPFVIDGQEVCVSASIGIALDTDRSHSSDDLLREADLAMYRAKSAGKSRYEIFDPSMSSDVSERLELESELRIALEDGDLELYYSASDGAANVSARWRHARRGILEGAALLSLAEESGLAVELSRWTLRRACRDAASWPNATGLMLPLAVAHAELRDHVEEALQESGLPAQRLCLSISEGTVSVATLGALSGLGVKLAFGEPATSEALPAAA